MFKAPAEPRRECVNDDDPFTQEALEDDIVQIKSANGQNYCFNADSFRQYMEIQRDARSEIKNPFTNERLDRYTLGQLITRLGLNHRLYNYLALDEEARYLEELRRNGSD